MTERKAIGKPLAADEREKRRWMLASTVLNAFLAVIKLAWGLFSGSTVVIADAIHSLSDVIGALLVYGAVRLAPYHSQRFPLGLHKLEDMAAVIGGLGVLFAGYEILRSIFLEEGVQAPSVPIATLWFMVVVLIIQAVFYQVEKRAARRLHSPGLNSDVVNWLGDLGAGLVVMAGIAGHILNIPYTQEAAVIFIAMLIFHGAYEVIRDGLLSLLDAFTAQEEQDQVRQYLESLAAVTRIRSLRIRQAGSVLFLNTTLELDERNFKLAHQLADDIADQLKTAIPRLESVTIHYEPTQRPFRRVASLFDADKQLLAQGFGKAVWIRMEDYDKNNKLISSQWVSNPYGEGKRGKGVKLAAWLITKQVDTVSFAPSSSPDTLIDLLGAAGIQVNAVKSSSGPVLTGVD